MLPRLSRPAALGAVALSACLAASLSAAPALAAALSFVAGRGADTGDCSNPRTPCRSISYAHGQTTAGGEIKLQEPGNYGGVIIRKSITITGSPGAVIIRTTSGDSITISAGAGGVVTITGLVVNGMNAGSNGMRVNSAAQVNIKDCVFKNHLTNGVLFAPTVPVKFAIDDTLFAANQNAGVHLTPTTGSTQGALHRVTITGGGLNSFGVLMANKSELRISDSLISNHPEGGIFVAAESTNKIWLSGNTITQNTVGFRASTFSTSVPTAESAGNNFIAGNTTDVATGAGTHPLSNLGPQ